MSWQKPIDGQGKNPYAEIRDSATGSVDALVYADSSEGLPMEALELESDRVDGQLVGKVSLARILRRVKGGLHAESIADGDELTDDAFVALTTESGNILQQGQAMLIRAVRVRKADGSYDVRKIAPVAIGVLAALSVVAGVAVNHRHGHK